MEFMRRTPRKKKIDPNLALPYTSGGRGTLEALNPHADASSLLTFVAIAVGSWATAVVIFLERGRCVQRKKPSGVSLRSAILSASILLALFVVESTPLIVGTVIEKKVQDWTGIDLMCLSRTMPFPPDSSSQRIFTFTCTEKEYTKVNDLYSQYLAALLCYCIILSSATMVVVTRAEIRQLRVRREQIGRQKQVHEQFTYPGAAIERIACKQHANT